MRFVPAENRIEAITYDTHDRTLVESSRHVPDVGQWQFTIEHDLGGSLLTLSPCATREYVRREAETGTVPTRMGGCLGVRAGVKPSAKDDAAG